MLLQRRNFREHRLAAVQLRRIPLPETVWKPRIGSITRSHEPAERANEHLFGAWRHRKARDRIRPATFQTVSPRTSVNRLLMTPTAGTTNPNLPHKPSISPR